MFTQTDLKNSTPEENPKFIIVDDPPKHYAIGAIDYSALEAAYKAARWGWGAPATPPTADQIKQHITESLGGDYSYTRSGGIVVWKGVAYIHEDIWHWIEEGIPGVR